jgi:hypothetical protein
MALAMDVGREMKKTENILAGVSLLLLLLILYVASYRLDVQAEQGAYIGHFDEGEKMPMMATYKYGGDLARTIYLPLQSADRQIRPEYWTWIYHAKKYGP